MLSPPTWKTPGEQLYFFKWSCLAHKSHKSHVKEIQTRDISYYKCVFLRTLRQSIIEIFVTQRDGFKEISVFQYHPFLRTSCLSTRTSFLTLWSADHLKENSNSNELRTGPPLWGRRQHARLSRSGPGFDPRSGQVSWVRIFRSFSSPVRQMSGSFGPPRSPNIIWPSLSSSHTIHYGRQWPEMLTRPKTLNIYTYIITYGSTL